jgi:archaellum component FlaG (FlaF/FlaG flagellin family)
LNNHKVVVINASLKEIKNAKARLTVFDVNGKLLIRHEENVNVPVNSKTDLWIADVPRENSGLVMFRLTLSDNKDQLISENDYWLSNGKYDVSSSDLGKIDNTTLSVRNYKKGSGSVTFIIKNTGKKIATFIKLNVTNPISGEIILPAYASDGYFSLLPNESRKIVINVPSLDKYNNVDVVAAGLNCSTLLKSNRSNTNKLSYEDFIIDDYSHESMVGRQSILHGLHENFPGDQNNN